MAERKGERELTRRDLLKLVVPKRSLVSPAYLRLDTGLCSACALCARDCPSGALTALGEDGIHLVFRGKLCDGCGICVDVCPEKCLRLEQSRSQDEAAVVLLRDEFARCQKCGSVIGSKAMIRRVMSKLEASDPILAAKIELCPVCKGRSA